MSRHCECMAGGMGNNFEISNIEGYKKWKETLSEDEQGLLHEEYDKKEGTLTVYFGLRWDKKEPLYKLDTAINYFHPFDEICEWGSPTMFWAGLSMFTKEPIELFQTDEEFPFYTKAFGHNGKEDGGYRVYANKGNLVVQQLTFKVIGEEKFNKKDLFEKEDLEYIEKTEEDLCDKCKSKINFKFKFKDRGYYDEIKTKHKYDKLCEKCYEELKKPFADMKRLEREIESKKSELQEMEKKFASTNGGEE